MIICQIEVYLNSVRIENQTVKRPQHIAPSDWLEFWEEFHKTEKPLPPNWYAEFGII